MSRGSARSETAELAFDFVFQHAQSSFCEGKVLRAASRDEEYLQWLRAHSRVVAERNGNDLAEKKRRKPEFDSFLRSNRTPNGMEMGSEDEDNRMEDSPREESTVPSSRYPSVLSSAHEEEGEVVQRVATRSTQRDTVMHFPAPARSPADLTTNSPISYSLAVEQRQSLYRRPSNPTPKNYAIESVYSISCSTPIHALALPPCASHLYTGGSDGLVRRYAIHSMLNCTGIDNPAFNNLTMKPGGSVPPAPDAKFPVLVAYWENEEPGTWTNTIRENAAFGTKNVGVGDKVSVMHSLAVQSEELWGLSGTAVSVTCYFLRRPLRRLLIIFLDAEWFDQSLHHST